MVLWARPGPAPLLFAQALRHHPTGCHRNCFAAFAANMAEDKRIELSALRLATVFKTVCPHGRYLPNIWRKVKDLNLRSLSAVRLSKPLHYHSANLPESVPRFCCRARGGSEGALGHLQERAFIGSSGFCVAYGERLSDRRYRLLGPVETRAGPTKHPAHRPAGNTPGCASRLALSGQGVLVDLAGVEPASRTCLRQLVGFRPHDHSLRADESPSVRQTKNRLSGRFWLIQEATIQQ